MLVADSDPVLTDEVASLLGDGYAVGTAYTSDAVLSELDDVAAAVDSADAYEAALRDPDLDA